MKSICRNSRACGLPLVEKILKTYFTVKYLYYILYSKNFYSLIKGKMTTLSLYIALFLGFNQDRAISYCYEAGYSNIIAEAYINGNELEKEYAKQEVETQIKVCKYILDKYMSSNRY